MTGMNKSLGDMDPEDFRRHGHAAIDWVANYLATLESRPVFPNATLGKIRAQLSPEPPRHPEPMEDIIADFETTIVPGLTHWNHPAFFAYFPVSASGPAILAETLAAAVGINAMLWRTSPAATEIEQLTSDWLRQMLGLPETFHGAIMDSASMATLVAIAAAREQVPGLDAREKGLSGQAGAPRLRLYTSDQAHSSIEKAAIVLGIGQKNVQKIPTDHAFRMDSRALEQAIRQDLGRGWMPFCVVSTAGTTSTASIDPLPEIAAICRRYGLWHHLDGAYGLMAAILPELRDLFQGAELVDSLVTDPHKWLFNPLECSAFYIKKPDVLKRAFSLVPDYLQTPESNVTNYMDWGPQLSRRFRSLKLWMVIRYFGHDGLAERLRWHMRMARIFADQVEHSRDFESMAPLSLATLCFRAHPPDIDDVALLNHLNESLMNEVNLTGNTFISHTKLNGQFALRMAIGNIRTEEKHVSQTWDLLQAKLLHLLSTNPSLNPRHSLIVV